MTAPVAKVSGRAALKAARLEELTSALADSQVAMAPPKELSSWGIVKTRCWVTLHDKLDRQTKLMKPSAKRMRELAIHLRRLNAMTADECNTLTVNLKAPKA